MLDYEKSIYEQGYSLVVGCDEAGRGPLCGPVVCAACILPPSYQNEMINDSKKLTDKKRRILFEEIKKVDHGTRVCFIQLVVDDNVSTAKRLFDFNEFYLVAFKTAPGKLRPEADAHIGGNHIPYGRRAVTFENDPRTEACMAAIVVADESKLTRTHEADKAFVSGFA